MHKREYYNYNDLVKAVEKKCGKSIYDWNGKSSRKGKNEHGEYYSVAWAKKHGLNYELLTGNLDKNSVEMEERIKIGNAYNFAEDGYKAEPEYQSFWRFLLDYHDIGLRQLINFSPKYLLEEQNISKTWINESWVKDILNLFIEVMEEEKLPDEIELIVSW